MTGKTYASVLLLEDEALIALDTEFLLSEAGFRIAGTLGSCAEAMEWLPNGAADIAILDIVLGDGISVKVAEALGQLRIPFLVYSGVSFDESIHPQVFADALWISKPCEPAQMIAAVVALMARTREGIASGGSHATGLVDDSWPSLTDDGPAGPAERRHCLRIGERADGYALNDVLAVGKGLEARNEVGGTASHRDDTEQRWQVQCLSDLGKNTCRAGDRLRRVRLRAGHEAHLKVPEQ